MIEKELNVINKLGLHARASGKLIEVTSRYASRILIGRAGQLVDGKNIMSLLMLGAAKGSTLHLQVNGPDESEAAAAVEALFADKFGEGE